MRKRTWVSGAVVAATGAALTLAPVIHASAAPTTLTIQVGGDSKVSGVGFEGMRFFAPPTMTVHKGDTISFDFRGFHTATLIPAGVGADDWRADNAGPGGTYALIQRDADDASGAFEFNKNAIFPSNPSCGSSSSPCTYDGKSLVNSGLPLNTPTFAVTINANPGSTFWVLCLVHNMMQTRISVVADNVTTTTQSQIASYRAATLKSDQEQAAAAIPKLQKQTRHKTSNGVYVWDAFAGYDGDGWGLDGMFPSTLRIHKNQWVRWHFGQLQGNVHTVTFPRSTAGNIANVDFSGQNVKCENPNGDTKADAQPPTFCTNGGPQAAEFEIRKIGVVTQGSKSYAGSGLHSSGVRGPDGLTTAPFDLKFTHTSSKSGFTYACAIHGTMMSGKVIVTS